MAPVLVAASSGVISIITIIEALSIVVTLVIMVTMGSDKPFLSFLVDDALLKRLDDFRFKNRFESRAAAIKWLLTWALDQKPAVSKDVAER